MKNKIPYKSFQNYILRSPLLPVNFFKELTKGRIINDDNLKEICSRPIIKEALYLSSPELMKEIEKWINGDYGDYQDGKRLKYSILKYLSRMSSRCTPFGLHAGCAVGEFTNEPSSVSLSKPELNKRQTRLDMNFVVALSQNLSKNLNIKRQLQFYPNSSIYSLGYEIRYVEYTYVRNTRVHNIVAVDNTDYLNKVLDLSKSGALLEDLTNSLVNNEITFCAAEAYIDELVNSQILVSELEPTVTEINFFNQIISKLEKFEGVNDIVELMKDISFRINKLDENVGVSLQEYDELNSIIQKLNTDFDIKYLFQTDMVLNPHENLLNEKIVNDIKKGLSFVNKITLPRKSTFLSEFINTFYERYESSEISLLKALDVENGIGYRKNQGNGDINSLIDDIILPEKNIPKGDISDLKWSLIDEIFLKKLVEAYKKNNYIIKLEDKDFSMFEENWDDLASTFSHIFEIIDDNGEQKIQFNNNGGGSSAANLLGRFCHTDENIYEFVKEIIEIENQIENDKVLAEIVHLPESRVGNILIRPKLREYEIPYLARSSKGKKYQIPVDDLKIKVTSQHRITLKSERLQKEVLPRLTNAHNYSFNSLPVYNFLCDLQHNEKRSGIGFSFGPLEKEYTFLPRIEYKNIILSRATWNFKNSEIKHLLGNLENEKILFEDIMLFMKKHSLPQFVVLSEGDNELLVNLKNLTSLRMFVTTVKNKKKFTIKEFLFDKTSIVKQEDNYYANQFIISFYNEEKLLNKI